MGLFDTLSANAGPIGAGIQAGTGLIQGVFGAIQQAKNRKRFENLLKNAPQTEADKNLLSYENTALQRALTSPTSSAMYKRQMQNIGRNAATGLRAAQDRRSGLAAASSLARQSNDAALNAEVAAEQQQGQRFSQAYAPIMAGARERQRVFEQNVMQPWQMRAQMYGQKAAAGSQLANVGLSNIFGAGSTLGQIGLYNKAYGGGQDKGDGGFFNTKMGRAYFQ